MDVVWFMKKIQGDVVSGSGSATDEIMGRTVELSFQFYDSERDTEKIDRVASPS